MKLPIAAIDENGIRSLSEDEIGTLIARMSRADDLDIRARSAVERVQDRATGRFANRKAGRAA